MQLVDPITLGAGGSPIELPGFLSPEHAMLPDGRLALFSWEGVDRSKGWLTLFDPDTDELETISTPFTSGVRVLGYSPALEQVVLLDEVGSTRLVFFDPMSKTFVTEPFDGLLDGMTGVSEMALFEGGRKLAFYRAGGYDADRIGEPPTVRIADLENAVLGEPIEIEGAVQGLVELPPEMVRDPAWPYGEVVPGIAFDVVEGRLFVAHADGEGLTVVNLVDATVEVVSLGAQPSFWAGTLSWLIPPAEAKGSEPSVSMSSWLSHDRSQLLVTGVARDAWRHPETQKLHASNTTLGLTVIDTDTFEVIDSLNLPVTHGVSTSEAIALAGTTSNLVFCDQLCDPANNDPEIEGEPEHSGLYLLDPSTLEIRSHYRPGAHFYIIAAFEEWLLVESFGSDGDYYETVDLTTATPSARIDFSTSFYVITERGILEAQFLN
ncbi:MAG: hypothetical protein ACR2NT_14085 [Acidimicrobiia bacterium]